jgi:hypothetical protein
MVPLLLVLGMQPQLKVLLPACWLSAAMLLRLELGAGLEPASQQRLAHGS